MAAVEALPAFCNEYYVDADGSTIKKDQGTTTQYTCLAHDYMLVSDW